MELTLRARPAPKVERLRVDEDEVARRAREGRPEARRGDEVLSATGSGRPRGSCCRRLSYSYVSDGFVVRTVARATALGRVLHPGREGGLREHGPDDRRRRQAGRGQEGRGLHPPDRDGTVKDAILAAASICGVDEVYSVGGAQSIAALAYGTESIPRSPRSWARGALRLGREETRLEGRPDRLLRRSHRDS